MGPSVVWGMKDTIIQMNKLGTSGESSLKEQRVDTHSSIVRKFSRGRRKKDRTRD